MSTDYRVVTGKNQDITGRTITQDVQTPAYASAITITTKEQYTDVYVGALSGALTLNAATTNAMIGDRLTVLFSATGANRTVTIGTGIAATASTIVVTAAKYGSLTCVFNGTAWVEVARSVTA